MTNSSTKQNKTRTTSIRKKKKKWFEIVASKEFGNKVLGETLASEPSELVGRSLKVNMMNLVDDYRRQGINVKFKIDSISGESAQCRLVGYDLLRSHVRRMTRKNADKMDVSFIINSKDGAKLRIKPMVVTRNRVSAGVITSIRKKTEEFISKKSEDLKSTEIFESVIRYKLQKDLKANLLKLCPVGSCEIRSVELLK